MREFVWAQEAPWGAVTVRATHRGVHSVEFTAVHEAVAGAPDPEISDALDAYFEGEPDALDDLVVDLSSVRSDTSVRVLHLLRERVRFGQTMTYGELAVEAELPGAAQLIGQIMGSNPVPIIVPCHRIVAADGSLGGFSGGLDAKRALFRVEGIVARRGGWTKDTQPTLF